jgi:hypothetical protein
MYDQHVVVARKLRPIITILTKAISDRIVKTERQSKGLQPRMRIHASCVEGRLMAVLLLAAVIQASNK